jgi:hypothetical protein
MFGCLRRSVICSKIKNNGPYTHHLLYGDILHRLFQSGLNSIDHSFAYFQRELTTLVSACQEELYAIDKPETQVIEELTKLIPNIQKWISDHSPHAQNKSPKLHQVMDIEERIWSYKYTVIGLRFKPSRVLTEGYLSLAAGIQVVAEELRANNPIGLSSEAMDRSIDGDQN